MAASLPQPEFIPPAFSARFTRYFSKYVRRMIAKQFNAVRILPEHAGALAEWNEARAPGLVLIAHCSWWDPLITLALHSHFEPGRVCLAPMDATQLKNFAIFRKVGIFGINPDDPRSLGAMGEFIAERFRTNPFTTLWITPQGRFTDVRAPIEIRPGAAAIAARTPGIRVISLAIEYAFWTGQKPEVFVSFRPVQPAAGRENSTPAWHRAMLEAMEENNRLLAAAVISRDPGKFLPVFDSKGGTGTNWWYDIWLRIRGRSTQVQDRHFADSPSASHVPTPPAQVP